MFSPAGLLRAAVLPMGPESKDRDSFCGPELSHREESNGPTQEQHRPHCPCNRVLGQDCLDGQILGQLRPLSEEEESSGATFVGEPAFPEMDSEDLRLASFYDWPSTAGIQPEPLAAAGFFHTGQQDKVRCFFCYGGLQSWERGDDPWTEHARWFPRCQFLLRSKGRDFVERIQAYTPLLGSWVSPSVLRAQAGWQSLCFVYLRHWWLPNRNNGKNRKIRSLPLPQSHCCEM
eukprot:XP_008760822.1 PREDICTED: baculoviral IAP repeat-containing protein 7 isoform X3 [Rattus norvegicus]